ncbi:MAG: alpha/beta hydrolase [Rickettsiales bacterium]|nr:alpha/beta hydrolase [Rickettsiales bacterium]
MKKIASLSLLIALISSCQNLTIDEKSQKNLRPIWGEYFAQTLDETKVIEVIVATNRKTKSPAFACSDDQFGVTLGDSLRLGTCKISVPKNHATGEISLTKDNRQSSQNFFKILEAKSLEQADLPKVLKSSNRTPLVFVHGFNVRFEEAILRAAQIAYDLKYQGPIVLFTWPAGAGDGFFEQNLLNKTYENNSATAKSSVQIFKNFLSELQKNDIKINLMVHSMGHQVVLPALKELAESGVRKTAINQLILNAPDFGVNDFGAVAKNIKKISDQTTLYCSYNDKAMLASKTFNKNERLGACANFEGVDVINVSAIDDPALGLGHGYYSSRPILSDISQTLFGIEANRRLFVIKSEVGGAEKYFLRK